jgi:hypothetical protein
MLDSDNRDLIVCVLWKYSFSIDYVGKGFHSGQPYSWKPVYLSYFHIFNLATRGTKIRQNDYFAVFPSGAPRSKRQKYDKIGIVVAVRGSQLGVNSPSATPALCYGNCSANDLLNTTDVRISTQTFRNRLHNAGVRSRQPAIRVPMTQNHLRTRLHLVSVHVTSKNPDFVPTPTLDESGYGCFPVAYHDAYQLLTMTVLAATI